MSRCRTRSRSRARLERNAATTQAEQSFIDSPEGQSLAAARGQQVRPARGARRDRRRHGHRVPRQAVHRRRRARPPGRRRGRRREAQVAPCGRPRPAAAGRGVPLGCEPLAAVADDRGGAGRDPRRSPAPEPLPGASAEAAGARRQAVSAAPDLARAGRGLPLLASGRRAPRCRRSSPAAGTGARCTPPASTPTARLHARQSAGSTSRTTPRTRACQCGIYALPRARPALLVRRGLLVRGRRLRVGPASSSTATASAPSTRAWRQSPSPSAAAYGAAARPRRSRPARRPGDRRTATSRRSRPASAAACRQSCALSRSGSRARPRREAESASRASCEPSRSAPSATARRSASSPVAQREQCELHVLRGDLPG